MSGLEGDLGDQCLGPPVHFPEADTDSSLWQLLKVKLGLGLEKDSCGFATKLPRGSKDG